MVTAFQKPRPAIIFIGIVLTMLVLTSFSFVSSPAVLNLFGLTKINATVYFISRLLYWLCLALVFLYAVKIEKQKLLIWQEKKYNIVSYIISIVAVIAAFYIGMIIIQLVLKIFIAEQKSNKLAELLELFRQNKFLLVFTAITAGITEELIFRGYLLPRMELLFKSPYIAIFVSSVLFGLMHYKYGTLSNMIGPFFIGLVCAVYYWKFRNIKVVILCHITWDLFALFVLLSRH